MSLYVYKGMSQTEISDLLAVSQKSIHEWKNEGNWDELQELNESGPNGIRVKVLEAINKELEGEKSNIDADKLAKLNALLKQLDRGLTIDQIFGLFKDFDNWLVEIDPHLATTISEMHFKYLQYRAQND